jgi:D-alanyl-D-alanine carboxypeptidase (penicillin-binding protein 5/6)
MVGTARAQWNNRALVNTNEWLTTFVGATGEVVTGVKTGTTDNAGECLIASVEVEGRTVLLVIMGSSQRYADATALYGAFRANYTWDAADARALSVLNRVYDAEGRAWFVQPVGDVPPLLQHQIGGPQLRGFRHVQMPVDEAPVAGMEIGVLEWWAGDEQIGTQSLILR